MSENEGVGAEVNEQTGEDVAAPASDEQQQNDSEHTDKNVPLAALQAERDKRQAAQSRIELLEAALKNQPQQQAQPQAQTADPNDLNQQFWDNPVGMAQAIVQNATANLKNEMSEAMARDRFGDQDYEAKIKVFGDMVRTDPTLIQQMHAARNPALFAYNRAKMQIDYGGADVASMEQRIRQQVEKELKQQYQTALQQSGGEGQPQNQELPNSFANTPGGGGMSSDNVAPDTDLAALYKR